MTKLTKLFEPIRIGSLQLPFRIMMTAMTTGYERASDRFANFYVERVRGGVGLIVIGNLVAIYPSMHGDITRMNTITSDSDIPRLQKWTKAIRDNGGKVAEVYKVGDCVEPHRVREAIASGFLAALKV